MLVVATDGTNFATSSPLAETTDPTSGGGSGSGSGTSTCPITTIVNISNVSELRQAIECQEDGQTWNIVAGDYGLAQFNDITAGAPSSPQTG